MFTAASPPPFAYRSSVDSAWLKRRLKARKASIADIARLAERDRSVISRVASGETPLPLWMTPHFASVLGVSEIEMLRRAGLQTSMTRSVPVISWAAAGDFADNIDRGDLEVERHVAFDFAGGPLFALEVKGDSMDRVAPDGSVIVVSYTELDLVDRDLGVFRRGGEIAFKRYRSDGGRSWLTPDSWSDRHAPIVPSDDDVIVTLGRVVGVPVLAASK